MIDTWEAIKLEEVRPVGRTKPLVIECSRQTDQGEVRQPMVVKAFDLPEIHDQGLFAEIIGNLVARDLGVDTPTPGLIHLSKEFCEITNAVLSRQGLHLRDGLGVGSEYLRGGLPPPAPGAALAPDDVSRAALIYGCDLLIQNTDRLPRNQNCARFGKRLVAFDFELAFSFLLLIGPSSPAWQVSLTGLGPRHLFYQSLRRQCVKWRPLITAVAGFDVTKVEEYCNNLPPAWQRWTARVCDHLREITSNVNQLEIELQRSLL